MRIAAGGKSWILSGLFLLVGFAQNAPDAALRVFSHGIIPVIPEQADAPVAPLLSPPSPVAVDTTATPSSSTSPPPAIAVPNLPVRRRGDPRDVAETAWRYFEKNYQPGTGWFDPVRRYSFTTMWDLSSGIAGVACAEKLGIISSQRASELLGSSLRSLAKMPLYNGELPNREYNTVTAAMSGPKAVAGKGTGWSALDVGRLLIWLKIVTAWHPEYAGLTREIVGRWKFSRLARAGEMYGVYYGGAREYQRQEGRLGYEQYSASGYERWGIPMEKAKDYVETRPVEVLGVKLAADKRNVPYLTSEPFLLAAFELGTIDSTYTALTNNLYSAQERRWEMTHQLTAASEDSLDRAPWFVYFNIYYQGQSWQCRDHSGQLSPHNCGFSTKAAFGWAGLLDDDYSRLLEENARMLGSPDGYLAGQYPDGQKNASLNINTNAVILEAMLYRHRGRHAFLETNP